MVFEQSLHLDKGQKEWQELGQERNEARRRQNH